MTSIVGYEFRMQKKTWIVCFVGIVWLGIVWLLQTYAPMIVVKAAQWVNAHEIIKVLMGLKEDISSVTYGYIVNIAMIPLVLLMMYCNFSFVADSLLREKYLRTWIYYYTIPISQTVIYILKLLIHITLQIIILVVWGILAWKISMCGTRQVEFFVYVVNRDMKNIILGMVSVALLSTGAGFLYGCILKGRTAARDAGNIIFFLILWALLPNMIQMAVWYLANTNFDLKKIYVIQEYVLKSRLFNPVYWSNPLVSTTIHLTTEKCIKSGIIAGIMVATGGIFVKIRKK